MRTQAQDLGCYVWVAYGKAPPYLPVAVADSAAELARLTGTSENCIHSTWCKFQRGRFKSSRFHRVRVGGTK